MMNELQKEVENILNDPDVPKFYSQTFMASLGTGDAFMVFKNHNTAVAVINMPLATMKSLAGSLMAQLKFLESKEVQVLSTEELNQKFNEQTGQTKQ
jgi:hypothetical protein